MAVNRLGENFNLTVGDESLEPVGVNYTVEQHSSDGLISRDTVKLMKTVICYVIATLGIPGSILSAIVWLKRHIACHNSSAVYLAALAINDLVFLLHLLIYHVFSRSVLFLFVVSSDFESVLVLSFSVQRLIAIRCPLQVCRLRFGLLDSIAVIPSINHLFVSDQWSMSRKKKRNR